MKTKIKLKTQGTFPLFIGPVYKINMPNFDFAQAELEEKFVEETFR